MSNELAFLAAIVESSDDAIIGLTAEGRIISWNQGASTIYGYSVADAIGRSVAMLTLPERHDEIPLLLKKLRRGERVRHFQTLHLAKNGLTIVVSLSVSPVINSSGRLLGASLVSRDVTERLHIEEALHETEEKYRSIFTAETDAIMVFDAATGRLVDSNEAALKLYGYHRDEFMRLSLDDLYPELNRSDQASGFRTPTLSQCAVTGLHRRRDGSVFTAEMSTSHFYWRSHPMLVGIVRDISERLRSQQLLHSLSIAKGIQQHLLPQQAPALPRFEIYAHSISCEEVGGDYYDFFSISGHVGPRLGFAVGDVSGHGIGAALLMAMAKGMLRSEVEHWGEDLQRIFAGMNRHLMESAEESVFMTLFFGLIDPVRRTLLWSSAGHGPVFWYRHCRGDIQELLPTAPPLSVTVAEIFLPAPPVSLEVGDILLLGTDGIWEVRNPLGEMFKTYRLRQLVATLAPKDAHQIHDVIMSKVRDFMAGAQQEDDMTLMVIKVVGD